jgi:NAD(P)-dependent dehydrogenase (short-subunit alcohol dehydrogenase family)
VGRSAEADSLVDHTVERFGSLDLLVNNAGTNPYMGPMVEIDDARMLKTYEINQASIVSHTRAAWRAWMKDHGGSILNITSIGGITPGAGIGWYNVTKAAVIHTTKQFAHELAPGVRVNAIAPGLVRTELARALWEKNEARVAERIPMHRIGEPDDIATAALFLLSSAASWITGQTLVVDGGSTNSPAGGIG